MKQKFLLILLLFFARISFAQDINFARQLIDTLTSPGMQGRGYVNNGDRKASEYLAGEFGRLGLLKFYEGYRQQYSFPMNTFPGKMEASANHNKLKAGSDFQVWAATPVMKGTFKVVKLPPGILLHPGKLRKFTSRNYRDTFILVDKKGISDKKALAVLDSLKFYNFPAAPGLIFVNDTKLVWSVAMGSRPRNYTVVDIERNALPKKLRRFSLDVETEFLPVHEASNVIGWIKGRAQADTFLVFTAHYDHLGRMGSEIYYPGANDNASGTSMVTDLARHYSQADNQPYYSMIFILLSGEEAGLLGSKYCAAHPPFDLQKVKFLVNLDMVGTGSEGITMVNATKYKAAYDCMVKINADNEYLLTVKERGESCNSDHCPFYEKGVPSVFIYSLGKEYSEYHNPDDRGDKIPLSEYNDIFRLMRDFMDSFGR
ncbi:MAG: M28 family peptidase [Bacteroidota bacterium]